MKSNCPSRHIKCWAGISVIPDPYCSAQAGISWPRPVFGPGRHILAQAGIRARPASGRPGCPLSPSGRHQAMLLGRRLLAPGWVGFPPPRRAFSQLPGWAGTCDPVRPRARARVGCPLHLLAGPAAGVAPSWARTCAPAGPGRAPSGWARFPCRPPFPPAPRAGHSSFPGWAGVPRPGFLSRPGFLYSG
jgi:hypothetical protein